MAEPVGSMVSAAVTAEIATNAPANAALVLCGFGSLFGPQSMVNLMESVEALASKVQGGDLTVIEQMLLGQALALQGVFTSLTHRASAQKNPRLLQTQLGLALRAQNQSRAALEALIQLKQPPTPTYIGQANIASQQQVNNSMATMAGMPDVVAFDQNKLLEVPHEQRLDAGATSSPGRADSVMAAVDPINRAKDVGWKGAQQYECHDARPKQPHDARDVAAGEQPRSPV